MFYASAWAWEMTATGARSDELGEDRLMPPESMRDVRNSTIKVSNENKPPFTQAIVEELLGAVVTLSDTSLGHQIRRENGSGWHCCDLTRKTVLELLASQCPIAADYGQLTKEQLHQRHLDALTTFEASEDEFPITVAPGTHINPQPGSQLYLSISSQAGKWAPLEVRSTKAVRSASG